MSKIDDNEINTSKNDKNINVKRSSEEAFEEKSEEIGVIKRFKYEDILNDYIQDIFKSNDYVFVLLKPDCLKKNIVPDILRRFENKGLVMEYIKTIFEDRVLMENHYKELKTRISPEFFEEIINFMISGPCVAIIFTGSNAIEKGRCLLGDFSKPGTIRGDYGEKNYKNVCHVSDSLENAKIEIENLLLNN